MIRFKTDVKEALREKGVTPSSIRPGGRYSGLFGQNTLYKFKEPEANITLDSLNKLCLILKVQPADLIEFIEGDEDRLYCFPDGMEAEDE